MRSLAPFATFLLLAGAMGCARPSPEPPAGSTSAARAADGPFRVATADSIFVDESRPTMANGEVPEAPSRTLGVTTWYPADAAGPRPLVVYSHGFTGHRREMVYLLEHLASHGFVVAALDFPLTSGGAAGGPNFLDLPSQPGDVRFVIDSVLAEAAGEGPLAGRVDPERIGAAGLSYGGLTTTLVAFHREEADPRVRGAISIAGPVQMLTAPFYRAGGPPFLMVAGTKDAFVPYELNGPPLLERSPGSELVAIEGGTHLGFVEFSGIASFLMSRSDNPDTAACDQIEDFQGGEDPPEGSPFDPLGTPEEGIDPETWTFPCQGDVDDGLAMPLGQQHAITSLAVRAFFESLLADDEDVRQAAAHYLRDELDAELAEAGYARAEPASR